MVTHKEIIEIFFDINSLSTESFNTEGKLTYRFSGKVETHKPSEKEIIFNESVKWENEKSLLINSKNIYRWNFLDSGNIKLEHLRLGKNNPVFLVEFYPAVENIWKSIAPHNCNNDLYFSELNLQKENPVLNWTVKGPTENYSLKTAYLNS